MRGKIIQYAGTSAQLCIRSQLVQLRRHFPLQRQEAARDAEKAVRVPYRLDRITPRIT